jgi:hypothetical protein
MFARRVWNIPIGYIFVAPESCLWLALFHFSCLHSQQ